MHDEARQILKKNHFVVVSFEWPGFEEAKHMYNVPIVTETRRHVARFAGHSLRAHIQHPSKGLKPARHLVLSSFLMLAVDLPRFCEMVQWTYLNFPSNAPVVMRMHGMSEDDWRIYSPLTDSKEYQVVTKLQFRAVKNKKVTAELEESLLKPFESMIVGNQKVVISGTSRLGWHEINRLQRRMGPHVLYVSAIAWRMLEIARNLKQDADDLVVAGRFELAAEKYSIILWASKSPIFSLHDNPWDSDCGAPVGLLARNMLDAASMAASLYVRIGRIDHAAQMAQMGGSMVNVLRMIPDRQNNLFPEHGRRLIGMHALSWMNIIIDMCIREQEMHEVAVMRHCLLRAREMFGGTEHLANDLALFNDLENFSSVEDLRRKTSACRLPPLVFNTPLPDNCTKPDTLEGLQDTIHLNKALDRVDIWRAKMTPEQIAELLSHSS